MSFLFLGTWCMSCCLSLLSHSWTCARLAGSVGFVDRAVPGGPGSAQEDEDLLAVGDGLGVAVDGFAFGNLVCHEVGVHVGIGKRF